MSEDEPLKEIPESIFADDDGSADARLAQALIKYSRGKAPLTDVVEALAYARVLIPVFANGEQRHVGKHGLQQDTVASTGVVAVQMPDGRAALPAFTDVEAMRLWNPDARPIPAEGPRAALAAVNESWSAIVLNPGMETVLIPRPAVWALGKGEHWRPAVVEGRVDDEVRSAVAAAVTLDARPARGGRGPWPRRRGRDRVAPLVRPHAARVGPHREPRAARARVQRGGGAAA